MAAIAAESAPIARSAINSVTRFMTYLPERSCSKLLTRERNFTKAAPGERDFYRLSQTLFQIAVQGVYRDTILEHPVAVANGDLIIFERLLINGNAKRSAHLVLPCVALSDIPALFEERTPSFT